MSKLHLPKSPTSSDQLISRQSSKFSSDTFYCFSPVVMLSSFMMELFLLVYVCLRYKFTGLSRIVIYILFCLAMFQLAEYNVCGKFGLTSVAWTRLGYIAITFLPPLGLHLVTKIANRGWQWLTWLAYTCGVFWTLLFTFSNSVFTGHICSGNYIIFQIDILVSRVYGSYYYLWLLVGIILATYLAINAVNQVRRALILQIVGYLVFLIPTVVIIRLNPETRAGIPSIMCGFAVLYAMIIVFGILPLEKNKSQNNLSKTQKT